MVFQHFKVYHVRVLDQKSWDFFQLSGSFMHRQSASFTVPVICHCPRSCVRSQSVIIVFITLQVQNWVGGTLSGGFHPNWQLSLCWPNLARDRLLKSSVLLNLAHHHVVLLLSLGAFYQVTFARLSSSAGPQCFGTHHFRQAIQPILNTFPKWQILFTQHTLTRMLLLIGSVVSRHIEWGHIADFLRSELWLKWQWPWQDK